MDVGRYMAEHGHEMLTVCTDSDVGLRAIIAVHDTTLGPALGGLRMRPFASEEEAMLDVLRLSEGMTFKSSAAGIDLGGGKAVIFGDPDKDKSDRLFERMGEFIEQLGGYYITAEDVGTSVKDIETVGRRTRWVTGVGVERGSSGDPSPFTALGVVQAMRAAAAHVFGSDDLGKRSVAVQGVGHVGSHIVRRLVEAGAKVIVSDVRRTVLEEVVERYGVRSAAPTEVLSEAVDIVAPCALGAVLNDETIPRLRCRVVCGAANNQLREERHGEALAARGIFYVPDFVANAGGIVNIFIELQPAGYGAERATEAVSRIFERTQEIIALCEREGLAPHRAAVLMAKRRIQAARQAQAGTPGARKKNIDAILSRVPTNCRAAG
jgi:leucine dehydrogenase